MDLSSIWERILSALISVRVISKVSDETNTVADIVFEFRVSNAMGEVMESRTSMNKFTLCMQVV
jgi:hypothetical protein